MKRLIVFLFSAFFSSVALHAQTVVLNENFSSFEGSLDQYSSWGGQIDSFVVESGELRLNASGLISTRTYINTNSPAVYGEWEFLAKYNFNPSSSNYSNFYFLADSNIPENVDDAYLIDIGRSSDKIRLLKKSGSTTTTILETSAGYLNSDPVNVRIKVIRNLSGEFELLADSLGGSNFKSFGTATDSDITTGSFVILEPVFTSTRHDLIFFDDFVVRNYESFSATNATVSFSDSLDVSFNYFLDSNTITPSNWELLQAGNPTTTRLINQSTARLGFQNQFSNGDYSIQLNNIQSTTGQTISPNSTLDFSFENPFSLDSVFAESGSIVQVQFSEPVDTGTLITTNFQISPNIGAPNSISIVSEQFVNLNLGTALITGDYTVTINGVKSVSGFTIPTNTTGNFSFINIQEADSSDVLIWEFMPDPPNSETEFVEIRNVSDKYIDLNGWTLADNADVAIISNSQLILPPDTFLVLTPSSPSLSNENPILQHVVSGFRSLNNSGDNIVLRRSDGILMDSLTYSSAWGGQDVSVERKSATVAAFEQINWAPSTSENLSTPGNRNTAAPPETAPEIIDVIVSQQRNITLVFNRAMNSQSAENLQNYSLSNGLSVESANFISSDSLRIVTSSDFPANQALTISIDGLSDVFGKEMQAFEGEFIFYVFSEIGEGDVVINEFWYDGTDNNTRYVELLNTTSNYFNLEGWELRRRDGISSNGGVIASEQLVMEPNSYLIVTSDSLELANRFGAGNYVSMSFPEFPSTTADTVRLLTPAGDLFESIPFDPATWGGNDIALERLSVTVSARLIQNWKESVEELGGTPGRANTVPLDTSPPQLLSVEFESATHLLLTFDELIDSSSIQTADFSITNSTVSEFNVRGEDQISIVFNPAFVSGETYQIVVSNVADIFGNVSGSLNASVTYYEISDVEAGDISITEFIHNPPDGLTDAVEVWNHSDKILDISNWKFSDSRSTVSITQESTILLPDRYLVIAPDSSIFPLLPDTTVFLSLSSFPALNNTSDDAVVIRDDDGTILDSVFYQTSWGGSEVSLERRSILVSTEYRENWGISPSTDLHTLGKTNEILPDNEAPKLLFAEIPNDSIIEFAFNERIQNFSLDFVSGSSVGFDSFEQFGDTLRLHSSTKFAANAAITLAIDGVSDIFGNTLSGFSTQLFYYLFSQVEAGDLVINEFWYDGTDDNVRYVELLNTTSNYFNLEGWEFRRRDGATSNGGVISTEQLVLEPNSYLVLTSDSLSLANRFGAGNYVSMSFPGFPSTTPDTLRLLTPDGDLFESVPFDPATWGGSDIALERLSPTVSGDLLQNWKESTEELGGTPGKANTVPLDTSPPQLLTVQAESATRILFSFDEILNKSTSQIADFSFSSGSVIELNSVGENQLSITVDTPLENGETYQFVVSNATDIFGNVAADQTISYTYYVVSPVADGDILITEFIHNPPDGLTDAVEVWNQSDKTLDINGWQFSDSRSTTLIAESSRLLLANQYLVIAPDSTIYPLLPDSTVLLTLSSFPALNNTSEDAVVIRDATGAVLDSVFYETNWGGSEVSLERRSNSVSSRFEENWGPSTSENFHSLGRLNAILPDTDAPTLTFSEFQSDSTLDLVFSERIQEFSLDLIPSSSPVFTDFEQLGDTVRLKSAIKFQDKSSINITITGIRDVFGNTSPTISFEKTYYNLQPPSSGNVFVTEFMYDPPTDFSEYIELYNSGSTTLDLSQLFLNNDGGTPRQISEQKAPFLSGSYIVLTPDSSLITLFPDASILVIGSRFSTLRNTQDAIVLKNSSGEIIDSLLYSNSWGGVDIALERRSIDVPASVISNWGDSPSEEFGSPGSPNSILPDLETPTLTNVDVIDSVQLLITFSEPIDPTSSQSNVIAISPTLEIADIQLFDNSITMLFASEISVGQSYSITLSGLADLFGNTMPDTTSSFTRFAFDESQPQDLIINEILYRHSAEIPEFVEFYNRSNKTLDLNGWQFSDESNTITLRAPLAKRAKSGLSIPVPPDSFIVFSADESFAERTPGGFFVSNLPSLSNAGDAIVLKNTQGVLIDSLYYLSSWGGDEGVSIERKDPFNLSNDDANWQSNPQGVSAGITNLVYEADNTAPTLLFATLASDSSIYVRFSEFIQLNNSTKFFVDGVQKSFSIPSQGVSNSVELFFGGIVGEARSLEIIADTLKDVRGNQSLNNEIDLSWPLSKGDLAINEILSQPIASSTDNLPDQSQYLELRNTREFAVSLENFFIHDTPNENGEFSSLDILDTEFKSLAANSMAVVYADTTADFGESRIANYFDLSNASNFYRVDRTTLSLNSSSDGIFIKNSVGITIDSVIYSAEWHNPNLADVRGIALERINPKVNSNQEFNWGSSTAEKGGTPGSENTIFLSDEPENLENAITIGPNPFSPDGDGFDDVTKINYQFDESDFLLRVRIFDRYGRMVRELVNNYPAGFSGELVWDGFDFTGKEVRIGIYIVIFEAYNSATGKNRNFKKTVVSARRM